jgi:hypothetical protein
MFENPFKKNPASKIEGLEGQIKAERMKLMSNEEKLKAEVGSLGGIEGLNEKMNNLSTKVSDAKMKLLAGGSLGLASFAALGILISAPSPESHQIASGILMGTGGLSAIGGTVMSLSSVTGLKSWWEKKKLENLKESATAQGITG